MKSELPDKVQRFIREAVRLADDEVFLEELVKALKERHPDAFAQAAKAKGDTKRRRMFEQSKLLAQFLHEHDVTGIGQEKWAAARGIHHEEFRRWKKRFESGGPKNASFVRNVEDWLYIYRFAQQRGLPLEHDEWSQ